MKLLYVFPHPDDESFGPGPAMHRQAEEGHEVYLLTLTLGGATRMRLKLGLSVEEMGRVRKDELEAASRRLGVSRLTTLDLPDNGLAELDPREIEQAVERELRAIDPDVVVTYPVHGVSGFHDHLVTHAAVKRAWCRWNEEQAQRGGNGRRLAFFTLTEAQAARSPHFRLQGTPERKLGCIYKVGEENLRAGREALDCYKTYRDTIEKTGIKEHLGSPVCFEIFGEAPAAPLEDLCEELEPATE